MRSTRDTSREKSLNIIIGEDIQKSRAFWVKLVQKDLTADLQINRNICLKKNTVGGRFRKLAPYEDDDGIWRVGIRMREFTPFTHDKKPPVLLPNGHRFTYLLMLDSHEKKHGGISETVGRFRLSGYWTVKANILAKKIKENCVTCKYLDHEPISQLMGPIPKDRLSLLSAWNEVELDLFGPYDCRSDVNKRSTKKIWGMLVVDVNSGAMYCDVVHDYSAQETLKTLRCFGSIRGWPKKICSDPGSQLQSTAGNIFS